jgi:hypothetical protein
LGDGVVLVEVLGMIPFATHIAAASIAGVLAFGAAWQVQAWRYGGQISDLKLEHAEAVASSAKTALKLTEHYRENADAAVKKAEARAAQNKRDADSLRAELDGLRGDLADVPDRIRNASREAVDQYAATATVVFGECAARYSELAISATGHASDVQTLMDAWPK